VLLLLVGAGGEGYRRAVYELDLYRLEGGQSSAPWLWKLRSTRALLILAVTVVVRAACGPHVARVLPT
jgi:hypothetical protein